MRTRILGPGNCTPTCYPCSSTCPAWSQKVTQQQQSHKHTDIPTPNLWSNCQRSTLPQRRASSSSCAYWLLVCHTALCGTDTRLLHACCTADQREVKRSSSGSTFGVAAVRRFCDYAAYRMCALPAWRWANLLAPVMLRRVPHYIPSQRFVESHHTSVYCHFGSVHFACCA